MSDAIPNRHGGNSLVEALVHNGVDTVYCVPGESFLPVLDALSDAAGIRTIVTRHEGAASNMADAYGKLTGRPGICFVTRGPGATHASNGVHTAKQDSTPMILFIGQIDADFREREAFQEVDYRQMFGGLAKWVTEIDSVDRIPEIIAKAFSIALSGRPGPVVIALPEGVLFGDAPPAQAPLATIIQAAPQPESMEQLRTLLINAQKPLVIVGGTAWDERACVQLKRFVTAWNVPVSASFRRQDLFDNRDDHYCGMLGIGVAPKLAERVTRADVLLVIGSRLGEMTSSGYTLVKSPQPEQTLIHVHPDPEELGRVYHAALPINAGMRAFAAALDQLAPPRKLAWGDWTHAARQDYLVHSTPQALDPRHNGVDLAKVVAHLNEILPDDAVIANGAGNYTAWVHRFYRYRQPFTQLAPTNGAMGYGFPAAIAAKLRFPARTVISFAGDGCFMMYPQELATAMQFGAPLVLIVVNNGMFGTIRMHQERQYPTRIVATQLVNPDFVALARSFGAHAQRVEHSDDFPAAFERAQQAGVAALIELKVDPRQITPQMFMA